MASLNRGFSNAVEVEVVQIVLRREAADLAKLIDLRKPVPAKLGVLSRDYLRMSDSRAIARRSQTYVL
jgi:hypothetical protein